MQVEWACLEMYPLIFPGYFGCFSIWEIYVSVQRNIYLFREITSTMLIQFYLNLPWYYIKKKYNKRNN